VPPLFSAELYRSKLRCIKRRRACAVHKIAYRIIFIISTDFRSERSLFAIRFPALFFPHKEPERWLLVREHLTIEMPQPTPAFAEGSGGVGFAISQQAEFES
jgi:hypothetical protein